MPKNKEFEDDDEITDVKKFKLDSDGDSINEDVDRLETGEIESSNSDSEIKGECGSQEQKIDLDLLCDSNESEDSQKSDSEYTIDSNLVAVLSDELKSLDLKPYNEELIICKVVQFCFENLIPISKLADLLSLSFISEQKINIPEESILYEKYVTPIYEKSLIKIREAFVGQKIFVSFSKTNNGNYSKNVIIGTLKPDAIESIFLIKTHKESFYDTSKFIKLFSDCLETLWPGDVNSHSEDVLLLLCDDSFLGEKAKQLKLLYPKIICHSRPDKNLHSIKNNLKMEYSTVDYIDEVVRSLVSKYKKHFVKKANLPLPPKRFVEAISYYDRHLYSLSEFFNDLMGDLDDEDENQIELYNLYHKNKESHEHLSALSSEYPLIVKSLNQIRSKIPLKDSLGAFVSVLSEFSDLDGDKFYKSIHEQLFDDVVCTTGFPKLCAISNALYETSFEFDEVFGEEDYDISEFSKDDLQFFRFAPFGGMDCKRCFPQFDKLVRSDSDLSSSKHFHMLSIIYCYYESIKS